jgi:hypothetical protein
MFWVVNDPLGISIWAKLQVDEMTALFIDNMNLCWLPPACLRVTGYKPGTDVRKGCWQSAILALCN